MKLVQRAVLSFLLTLFSAGCSSSPSNETAKPPCTTTADCGEGAVCREEQCQVPQTCQTSDDCGINRECDPSSQTCVECLRSEHCASNETCLAGICRVSCDKDTDCENKDVCAPNGYCAECADDLACADDEHCTQGKCAADSCMQRTTRCNDEGNVLVCSDRGNGELELPCPAEQSCGTGLGPAWCEGWICVPDQVSCSDDSGTALLCSPDGLSLAEINDCAGNNAVCSDGICQTLICDPLTWYCKDGHVYECNGLGTTETIKTSCFSGQYCDEVTATCLTQVCTPGAAGCDDGQRATCNELGSEFEDHQSCKTSETCEAAQCEEIVCEPFQSFCAGGNVQRCNSLGTASSLYDSCSAGEFCSDSGFGANCSTDVCNVGTLSCLGESAGTCNAEGSGLEADAVLCSSTDQVCIAGDCKDVICQASTRLCVDGNVHACVSKGSATSLYTVCQASQYCDETTATCRTKICSPTQPGCDGTIAKVCNADGSAWEAGGSDCAALGNHACDAGVCRELICPPAGRYCNGTQVMSCNALGTAGTTNSTCSPSTHCFESTTTYAYCRSDVCTANQPTCDGEVATTCSADGGLKLPGGTNCLLADQACYGGACKDRICAGSYECVGGDYHRCLENSTATSLYDDCTPNEFCSEALGCRAHVCTPNSILCSNTTLLRTCNADGSNYSLTTCGAGDACWNDACAPTVCAAGDTLCDDGDFYHCDGAGTFTTLLNDCVEAQFCDANLGCRPDVCAANTAICNGNVATTCNTDGSGPALGGTDCGISGQGCNSGACEAVTCTDGQYICDGQVLTRCSKNGTVVEVEEDCGAGSYCVAAEGACLKQICSPGSPTCLDFHSTMTCSSDGQGYDLPSTACAVGEVCNLGLCIATASSCSISEKTWSTPVALPASVSGELNIDSDPKGNVFVSWIESSSLHVMRYAAADGIWSHEFWPVAGFSYLQKIVVAGNGDAVVAYLLDEPLNEGYGIATRQYDAGLNRWSDLSVPLRGGESSFDWKFDLAANLQGQFILGAAAGYGKVAQAAIYDPVYGWFAPRTLGTQTTYSAGVDITNEGVAIFAWTETTGTTPGVKWSTFDFSTGAWTVPQRVAGPVDIFDLDATSVVRAVTPDGSRLQFLYTANSEPGTPNAYFTSWSSSSGLAAPTQLTNFAYPQRPELLESAHGDLFAMGIGSLPLRLPANASTWVSSGSGPSGNSNRSAFSSGELLTTSNGNVWFYRPASGWTSTAFSQRYGPAETLPGCEAVWVYRQSSRLYASFLR